MSGIEQLNLDGYQFVSRYPLGFDAGNTLQQRHDTKTASYVTLKGPFFGSNGSRRGQADQGRGASDPVNAAR